MKPNKPLALQLAKRQLVELVFDAVNLEGINFTIPEVQTLVDGITVGGHKISDTIITLNQKNTWLEIFEQIKYGHFSLSMENIHYLHSIAAKEEAMEWGVFRSASVLITGTDYEPPGHENLERIWEELEFNEKMIHYYETDDSLPMIMFLRSCLNKRIAEEFSITW